VLLLANLDRTVGLSVACVTVSRVVFDRVALTVITFVQRYVRDERVTFLPSLCYNAADFCETITTIMKSFLEIGFYHWFLL